MKKCYEYKVVVEHDSKVIIYYAKNKNDAVSYKSAMLSIGKSSKIYKKKIHKIDKWLSCTGLNRRDLDIKFYTKNNKLEVIRSFSPLWIVIQLGLAVVFTALINLTFLIKLIIG